MIGRTRRLAPSGRLAAMAAAVLVVSGCTTSNPFRLDDATNQVDGWVETALSDVTGTGDPEIDDHSTCRPTDADSEFGGQDAADAGELLSVRSTTTIPVVADGQGVVDAISAALDDAGWAVTTPDAPSVLRAFADPPDAAGGGHIEVIEFDLGNGTGGRVILNVTSRCFVPTDDQKRKN